MYYPNLTSPDLTGSGAPLPMTLTDGLQAPVLLLAGQGGQPLSPEDLAAVDAQLRGAGKTIVSVTYDGVNRGFLADPDPHYDRAAADDAWKRTLDWLGKYLA